MTAEQRPLAHVYDRCATVNTAVLELRLKECARYITAQGWGFGGWWVDRGDCALTDDRRPAFDTLLRTLQAAEVGRARVCLVYDWHRLSRDMKARGLFTRRVLLAGGWVETVDGDKRTTGLDLQSGRLTSRPVTA